MSKLLASLLCLTHSRVGSGRAGLAASKMRISGALLPARLSGPPMLLHSKIPAAWPLAPAACWWPQRGLTTTRPAAQLLSARRLCGPDGRTNRGLHLAARSEPDDREADHGRAGTAGLDSAQTQQPHGVITGVVQRITYRLEATGYTIFRFKTRGGTRPDDRPAVVTAVATLPHLNVGQSLELEGTWDKHERFGPQLRARLFATHHLSCGLADPNKLRNSRAASTSTF